MINLISQDLIVKAGNQDQTVITEVLSRGSIISLSVRLWQIIDLLATEKSQYFVPPPSMIVNFFFN